MEKIYDYTGENIEVQVNTLSNSSLNIKYYTDIACTKEINELPKNAGIYYVTVKSLGNDEYKSSELICKKAITINRINPILELEKSEIILGNTNTHISYNYRGDGVISCNSLTSDIECNVDIVNKKINISKKGDKTGKIKINGSIGTNYNSVSKEINVINEEIIILDNNTLSLNNNTLTVNISYNNTLTYEKLIRRIKIVSDKVEIYDNKNNIITNDNYIIGTGCIIKLLSKNYLIIVNGDINSDGKISALDYIAIRNYIMKTVTFNEEKMLAADVNKDLKISALDYITIRNIILGGKKVEN